ncbi:unannotated protein [freshwater metagenome]|uniref:Unannotated protein n=1 Tax=freshwater metagenome TaxID=449393 RepID=A0A6J7PRP7_9ZZZZ
MTAIGEYTGPMSPPTAAATMPTSTPPTRVPGMFPTPPMTTTVKPRTSRGSASLGLTDRPVPYTMPASAAIAAAAPKVSACILLMLTPSVLAVAGSMAEARSAVPNRVRVRTS